MKTVFALAIVALSFSAVAAKSSVKLTLVEKAPSLIKKPLGDNSWCPTCVEFFSESIQELLDIILNGGVIGGCSELCGYLPNSVEQTVCSLLCDIVGIEAFIDLIQDVDPDPVYYCEELNVCKACDTAKGHFNSLVITPAVGMIGTQFSATAVLNVTSEICTGELVFQIAPPGAAPPEGTGELLVDVMPGVYKADLKFSAQPSEMEPWSPGTYGLIAGACEGSCGSKHAHSYLVADKQITFKIQ